MILANPNHTSILEVNGAMGTFKLSRADQAQSPLLSLPAELRRKILRNVHKTTDFITPLKTKTHPLSAQCLSSCQQLYAEARNVLYKENVLSVWVIQGHIYLLNTRSRMPRADVLATSFPAEDLDIISPSGDQGCQPLPLEKRHVLQKQIGNFKTIDIRVNGRSQHENPMFRETIDVFSLCRELHGLCFNKRVKMRFVHSYVHTWPTEVLQYFKALRCKTFSIYGRDDTVARAVIATITSDTLVQDSFGLWEPYNQYITQQQNDGTEDMFGSSLSLQMEHLTKAVRSYESVDRVKSMLHALARELQPAVEAIYKERRGAAESEYVRALKKIEKDRTAALKLFAV